MKNEENNYNYIETEKVDFNDSKTTSFLITRVNFIFELVSLC